MARAVWYDDKKAALTVLKWGGQFLEYATDALRADKEVALAAVTHDGKALRFASHDLRADPEVVLEAVKQCGSALQFASSALRADKTIALEAVKKSGESLEYVSEELLADEEVVLEAVKSKGRMLKFASFELRASKEFVLQVVRVRPEALEHACEELRDDREVVVETIKVSGYALRHASSALRADKDLVLLVARSGTMPQEKMSKYMPEAGLLDEHYFWGTVFSRLAVPGEGPAPLLTVQLSYVSNDIEVGAHKTDEKYFLCEVLMLSGSSFNCQLPDRPSIDVLGDKRPGPILNDLANKIVKALPKHTEVKECELVFLNFVVGKDGEDGVQMVTPWEWSRPLVDFVASSSRGANT